MNKTVLSLAILLFAFALAGCNTTRGVGQDLEAAGDAIADAAEDVRD